LEIVKVAWRDAGTWHIGLDSVSLFAEGGGVFSDILTWTLNKFLPIAGPATSNLPLWVPIAQNKTVIFNTSAFGSSFPLLSRFLGFVLIPFPPSPGTGKIAREPCFARFKGKLLLLLYTSESWVAST
jgi:hypothetical protein